MNWVVLDLGLDWIGLDWIGLDRTALLVFIRLFWDGGLRGEDGFNKIFSICFDLLL